MDTPDLELLSGRFLERYRIIKTLGQGGMGVVYLAHDRHLSDRPVAIKFLRAPPGLLSSDEVTFKRFEREAQLLSRLSHPNLVRLYDYGAERDLPYIVFEYAAGETLQDVIAREAPMPARKAGRIALQILAGLEALHGAGIVHRDLKPGNVIMSGDGLKLIDLGIARALDALEALTRSGRCVGTPGFMAPEQVKALEAGPTADLYALGTILFLVLTKRLPYDGSPLEVMAVKVSEDPPPVESVVPVPEPMAGAVNAMLQRDPAARPADVAAVRKLLGPGGYRIRRTTLKQALPGGFPAPGAGAPVVPTGRVEPGEPAPGPGRLAGVALAFLVLGLMAAGFLPGRRAPRIGPVTVERGLSTVTMRVTREPPGPMGFAVWVGSRPRPVVASSVDRRAWSLTLKDLEPGAIVRVETEAGRAVGPSLTFRHEPVRARNLTLEKVAGGLVARFRTSVPVRCRVTARTRAGDGGLPWDHSASMDHKVEWTGDDMPISRRWRVEHELGEERTIERLELPDAARRVLFETCTYWMEVSTKALHEKVYREVNQIDKEHPGDPSAFGMVQGVLRGFVKDLPPPWWLAETGGRDGLLDYPGLPPAQKQALYDAISGLEELDAIFEFLRVPALYPYQQLLGDHFGPSLKPHYASARVVPVVLEGRRKEDPVRIFADLAYPPESRPDPTVVTGSVDVPVLRPGARVELHGRARLVSGRSLAVTFNQGHTVRLSRPDRSAPSTPTDYYTAFDPAFLISGRNTVSIRIPPNAPLFETMQAFWLWVDVDPPGFSLRVLQ